MDTNVPVEQLKTNRSLGKFILLNIITLGIYSLFFFASIAHDVNLICSKNDGKKTMSYWLLFFIIGPITLEIGMIVWIHRLCNRIGNELSRRGIDYKFSAVSYWGWAVLGSLIAVGPFVFLYKLCRSMNLIAQDFNAKG